MIERMSDERLEFFKIGFQTRGLDEDFEFLNEIERVRQAEKAYRDRNGVLENTICDLQKENAELQADVTAWINTAGVYQDKIEKLEKEKSQIVTEWRNSIDEKDAEIEDLRKEHAEFIKNNAELGVLNLELLEKNADLKKRLDVATRAAWEEGQPFQNNNEDS